MSQPGPHDPRQAILATARDKTAGRPFWPAFVWSAALLALSAGFLLGAFIFVLRAAGAHSAAWQAAATQVHGHVQIFGWGGLMVVGISLHFLPRLLSAPLARPGWPRTILGLMGSGLVVRVLAQPALTHGAPRLVRLAAASGMALAASLELLAATMVVGLIGSLWLSGRSASKRVPSAGVSMLIGVAFVSFETAMVTNSIASIRAALMMQPVIPFNFDDATTLLGLVGFLCAISLAMSARLFPLYIQTGLPREGWLRAAGLGLMSGLVLRTAGALTVSATLVGIGQILQATALFGGVIALRVFEPRRQLPRRRVRVVTDALQLQLLTAYLWLLAACCFALLEGMRTLGLSAWAIPADAERHAIGAGFVTVLILGVGAEMLPGLARSRIRWAWARWLTLLCANLAALTRVVPLITHGVPNHWNSAIMGSAGLLGAVAIALFLMNVPLKIAPRATQSRATRDSR